MQKNKSNLKLIALVLSMVLLLQSCKAYQNKTVTTEDALLTSKGIKVKTFNNETYQFESLRKEDGKLYGIAKRKSETAKKLIDRIIVDNPSSKFVKILLPDDFVKEIHLQRKGTAVKIITYTGVGILAGIGAILIAFMLGQ
ncbi:hypothetical protein [Lutibacter flavus]|uniref:Lipoprotein n=1 Tax=Lutibacter flavus TaxID=691689 RepID=A0A238ZFS9_9FLAO|nr:hypothetical protein [Lutibacter flavus]SNR82365.1 hypothetical protein SAMN04488111_3285 [Lutibacter flavus]